MSSIFKLNLAKIIKLRGYMSREKNIRKLNFKPKYKEFIPNNTTIQGVSTLLHEEIEAIYLMDILSLYQEDAAKSMEISRPTFTRILKNARRKLSKAIIGGYKIIINDEKEDFIVAVCLKKEDDFSDISLIMNYICFYQVNKNEIRILNKIKNPILNKNQKPAIVLPEIFLKNKVNFFICSKIGEGLKNSLLSKGIQPIRKNKIVLKDIFKILL